VHFLREQQGNQEPQRSNIVSFRRMTDAYAASRNHPDGVVFVLQQACVRNPKE
jgi:hypothetical protein